MRRFIINFIYVFSLIAFIGFLGIYLYSFHSGLSQDHSSWGSFGNYFAGTIGICFSLLSVVFLYLTFYEQRKQRFENSFQQFVSNYYSLLSLIKENWLHNDPPQYLFGREIFGRAIREIHLGDAKNTFNKHFETHVNVYQHHCYYLVGLFELVYDNNELNEKERDKYINRFFSMVSTYEKVFFAFFVKYSLDSNYPKMEKIKNVIISKLIEILNFGVVVPHKEQIEFIYNELNKEKKSGDLNPLK